MFLLEPDGCDTGYGTGNGDGDGFDTGYGTGNGDGNGYGNGDGNGYGNGDGTGYGTGFDDGYGNDNRYEFRPEQLLIMAYVRSLLCS